MLDVTRATGLEELAARACAVVAGLAGTLVDEKALQAEMGIAFGAAGIPAEREVRLSPADVVDFMLGDPSGPRVAVEVKVKGGKREIHDQCARYCASGAVGALVLATAVATGFPPTLHGKPCRVASLGRGWLAPRGRAGTSALPGPSAAPPGTYGSLVLDRDAGRWVLATTQVHVAIRLKQIFPRLPKAGTSPFRFPADDLHATELEWFMARYPMTMSQGDRAEIAVGRDRHDADVAEAGRILDAGYAPSAVRGLREGESIRPYQAQAAELATTTGSLLLGDEVGLGKTFSTVALALREGRLPMAVVVHGHLQRQWAGVFMRMAGIECHLVETTRPYTLPDAPVVLFRYSNVRGWADVFASGRFRTAVWDEIQELRRGTSTDKGKASMALARATSVQLGLSATPIYNYGSEIYEVLSFLPGRRTGHVLGTREEFGREWCPDGKVVSDPPALGSYMREQRAFLRRTKADVGRWMRAVETSVVDVPYDHEEERKVEDLARTLAIRTLTGRYEERGRAARDLDLLMRETTGIAKARGVADFVRILVEDGQRVLLTGWHRRYYDLVMRGLAGIRTCLYTGTEGTRAKEASKAAFLSGEAPVMIMSNRSGAGLDGLQHACSTIVIGELDWSGQVHAQLIGRLDREGQALPVTAYYLVCDGGSDPAIVELLGLKASQARGIVDPGRPFEEATTDEGRISRLARGWLERRGIVVEAEATGAATA